MDKGKSEKIYGNNVSSSKELKVITTIKRNYQLTVLVSSSKELKEQGRIRYVALSRYRFILKGIERQHGQNKLQQTQSQCFILKGIESLIRLFTHFLITNISFILKGIES